MTENVNENENSMDEVFDPGQEKTSNGAKKDVKVEFNENNYLNTRLGTNETSKEIRIRIILTPDIDGKNKVDIPVQVHSIMLNDKQQKSKIISRTSRFKSFICLNDPHLENHDDKGCPLCHKMKELFDEANNVQEKDARKAICKQAYKYESKTAYIVRCIERGKESEGVKFWRFNKRDDGSGILDTLTSIYRLYKSDGVNIFDYNTGHDLILSLTKDPNPTPGAPDKTVIKIMAAIKPSKLAETQEEIDALVNDGKDWRNMYRSKSYDYLKLVAEGESPIWSKEENKYVAWVDTEELKEQTQELERQAAESLSIDNNKAEESAVSNNFDSELPF